ncbi:SIP domain-containing protein [Psychrobacter sp. Arc29]|uniref:SIP domain-containing protein n=1 Tax=Psychrobacter sp. Arc29 TaxID=3046690 RepID=UPI00352E6D5A
MANILLTSERNRYGQDRPYTPLNAPELKDIISHINEEHVDELLGFLQAFTPISTAELDNIEVQLTTVYAEGMQLQVQPKNVESQSVNAQNHTVQNQTFFIAFPAALTHPDELQVQYIALKQRADKKLGKKTIKLIKQTFTVENRYKVSENMLRLELSMLELSNSDSLNKQPSSVPINDAGYAYLFDLAHNSAANNSVTTGIEDNARSARAHRYYTLRKAWQTPTGVQAWVDVFLHGDTLGGSWAQSLQVGETIVTKREFPEKVDHLRDGQALLIADETSMPTVARLLELWENPTPPLVVCVTHTAADQRYFDNVKMRSGIDSSTNNSIDSNSERTTKNTAKDNFTVLPIVTDQQCSGQHLASIIDSAVGNYLTDQSLKIDQVWGALEASTVKALRPMLRERLDLSRAEVVIKVYWRQD